MSQTQNKKNMYFTKNVGSFVDAFEFMGVHYQKIEDLRYGTNPHQAAAFYKPLKNENLILGGLQVLKSGKGGLSQTNFEDMHHALGIVNYFDKPSCAVMKHINPSGAATQTHAETTKDVYLKARDSDPQAAFGSVVAFNTSVDSATAETIMETIVECVVAPDFAEGVMDIFNDEARFKRNKHIRIIKINNLSSLPKFTGDDNKGFCEIKVFGDGSMIVADPFLTKIKNKNDLETAAVEHPKKGSLGCKRIPTEEEFSDLLFAWYINIHVRSNGIVIVKNGSTLAVGTGEQDRVGAVQQGIGKVTTKYKGREDIQGAVLASDGFFPFRDSIDLIADAGITAIVQPGGSISDYDIIEACNERDISMVFTGERCFAHH